MRTLCLLLLLLSVPSYATPLFNDSQLAYLQQRGEIRYCVDPNWLPYEAIQNGQYIGIGADYLALLQQRLPVPLQLYLTFNWKQSLDAIKNGHCDIIPLLNQSASRERFLNFTSAYLRTPEVIVTTKKNGHLSGLNALIGKKVALVPNYRINEVIAEQKIAIDLLPVGDQEESLWAVANGAADATTGSLIAMQFLIQDLGLSDLKIAGNTGLYNEFRMGVRNDEPELHEIMQTLLNSLSPTETLELRKKWLAVEYTKAIDFRPLWQLSLLFLLTLLLVSYCFWRLWQRNRIIDEKNQQIEALSIKNQQLSNALDNAQDQLALQHQVNINATNIDQLTGVANRLAFMQQGQLRIEQALRVKQAMTLLRIDIDHFSNNQFDEAQQQQALQHLTPLLAQLREPDLLGRLSHHSFAILLHCGTLKAQQIAERLRSQIASHPLGDEQLHFTISIGIASLHQLEPQLHHLLKRAESALQQAKQQGRNCCVMAATQLDTN